MGIPPLASDCSLIIKLSTFMRESDCEFLEFISFVSVQKNYHLEFVRQFIRLKYRKNLNIKY